MEVTAILDKEQLLWELSCSSPNQQICSDASCIVASDYGLKWCKRKETRVRFLVTAV